MLKHIYKQKTKKPEYIHVPVWPASRRIHEKRPGPFITAENYHNQAPNKLSNYAEHGFRLAYETLIIVYVMS